MPRVKFASTNQKNYPDLGSDVLSVWNFLAHFSMSVRGETIGDVVCFLRLELTFTLIKTVLSLFDFLGEVKSLT